MICLRLWQRPVVSGVYAHLRPGQCAGSLQPQNQTSVYMLHSHKNVKETTDICVVGDLSREFTRKGKDKWVGSSKQKLIEKHQLARP